MRHRSRAPRSADPGANNQSIRSLRKAVGNLDLRRFAEVGVIHVDAAVSLRIAHFDTKGQSAVFSHEQSNRTLRFSAFVDRELVSSGSPFAHLLIRDRTQVSQLRRSFFRGLSGPRHTLPGEKLMG